MRAVRIAGLFLSALGATASAYAQVPVPLSVSGNQASGRMELAGGIGADLTLTFEQVGGLTPASLTVTAKLVDPLDAVLVGRLPDPGALGIPATFPVLIRIEPPAASALTFSGVVTVSVYTHNLNLDSGLPLSMFSAPLGAVFADVMAWETSGSHRAGGTQPAFSEFLILADHRPLDAVIGGKFDRLQAALTGNAGAIPVAVQTDLQTRLDRARSLYQAGSLAAAGVELSGLQGVVLAHSGSGIPNVWQAHSPLVNVAGLLRAHADTLKFSLNRKAASSP